MKKKTKSVWVQPWDTSQPYLQPPTCSATLLFITVIIILAVIVIISYSHNTECFPSILWKCLNKNRKKKYNLLFSLTYSDNKRQQCELLNSDFSILNLPSKTDSTWCVKTIVASDMRSCKRKSFLTDHHILEQLITFHMFCFFWCKFVQMRLMAPEAQFHKRYSASVKRNRWA